LKINFVTEAYWLYMLQLCVKICKKSSKIFHLEF